MTPLTRLINAMHHGQLTARQHELLIALLLNLAACRSGMRWCPEMSPVQATYRELLAAGNVDQHP